MSESSELAQIRKMFDRVGLKYLDQPFRKKIGFQPPKYEGWNEITVGEYEDGEFWMDFNQKGELVDAGVFIPYYSN